MYVSPEAERPSRRRVRTLAVVFLAALAIVPVTPGIAGLGRGAPLAAPGPVGPNLPIAPVHPPGLPVGHTGNAGPLNGHDFYTQQGASVNDVNGQRVSVSRLNETFVLAASPYPTAYELNGLSSTGDWYQIIISDNWPGCNSGFELGYETWTASQVAGPVNCDATVTLHRGDTVRLGLNFSSTSVACLDLYDVSTSTGEVVCESQPDTGATGFSPTSGTANSNGYYTGPMTEIINQTANSCPDYKLVPTLDYRWPSNWWVTTYTPWSDEFDLAYGTSCYTSSEAAQTLSAGDPATYYVDTASGTSYGPHWGGGQNLTLLNASTGWRYQTDPKPINSSTVSANLTTVPLGGSVLLTVTGSGGVSPYGALWLVNGSILANRSASFAWSPSAPGTFQVRAYLTDATLGAYLSANTLTITVTGRLSVSPLTALPSSGRVDANDLLTLSSQVLGGTAPIRYTWTGLPPGCGGVDAASLSCRPSFAGSYNVTLTAADSNYSNGPNGTVLTTPLFHVQVDPALSGLLTVGRLELDAHQLLNASVAAQGGRVPYTYNWSGVPAGCAVFNASAFSCRPISAGVYSISVSLSDANGGGWQAAGTTVQVLPAVGVGLLGDRNALDVGQSIALAASPSGGSGTFTFLWTGLPAPCASANRTSLLCAPNATGDFAIRVLATDTLGGNASSTALGISVFSAPSVSLVPASPSIPAGGRLELSAQAGGGQPGYRYSWTGLPAGCVAPLGADLVCDNVAAGTYHIGVQVTDSLGGVAHGSATVQAGTGSGGTNGPGLLGLDTLSTLVLLGAIAAVAAIVVALAVRRSRAPPPE